MEQEFPAQPGQAIGEFPAGSLELVAPGEDSARYRTRVSVPILRTVDENLRSEIRGKLRGKSDQESLLVMKMYQDRLDGFSFHPASAHMPPFAFQIRIVVAEPNLP